MIHRPGGVGPEPPHQRRRWKLKAFVLLMLGLALFLALQTPSNEGDWQIQHRVLPQVTLTGDQIKVKHLRDFRYNADQSVAAANYLNASFKLSDLSATWLGISHFGRNGMAHVLLSFEFAAQQQLVVSIEARMEKQDLEYSPIKGLLRSYTKTIVLGTERDVIGLRSHVRGERVLLYRLNLSELQAKALLLSYLRTAQALNTEPSFYNTLIDNCMTGLLAESQRYRRLRSWLDHRILLPGFADELAQQEGLIEQGMPIGRLREQSQIDPTAVDISAANFSSAIRGR